MRVPLALIAFFLVLVLPVMDATACVKRRSALVETAASPRGEPWTVEAVRSRNGDGCDKWLFQVIFRLPNVGGFNAATSIPVGSHTPKDFTISALDAEGPEHLERAFGGYTGRETARLVAVIEDGSRVEIIPKYPPLQLRERFVWMRGFRYFVYYYPPGPGVKNVLLFTKRGHLLHRETVEPGGSFL